MFRKFAAKTSELTGTSWAFITATLIIIVWSATGPVFHYSDTWQLVINTGTTIITFLMVFLIQNTQNRDATAGASNHMMDLDKLSDEQLKKLEREYKRICGSNSDGDAEDDAQAAKAEKASNKKGGKT
jgi:low affinity Fe/Cu permease